MTEQRNNVDADKKNIKNPPQNCQFHSFKKRYILHRHACIMPPPRDICYKLPVSATLSQLSGKDELPYECGGASLLLNVRRVVL